MPAPAVSAAPQQQPKAAPQSAAPSSSAPALDGGAGAGTPLFLRGAARFAEQKPPASGGAGGSSQVPAIQAKLIVNKAGDRLEQEADDVAQTATAGAPVPSPRLHEENGSVPAQASATPKRIATDAAPVIPPPDAGSPLDGGLRNRVEPLVGSDLGDVRVHDGPAARNAANALGARAFTHRQHIWLGPGESRSDDRLIAHELTHVVQQTGDTAAVQRVPADYRHPEDGAVPHQRMLARMREEVGDDADLAAAPRRPEEAVEERTPQRRADTERREADRTKVAAERAALEPQARPDVDRAAQERPVVVRAAADTQARVDGPPSEGAKGDGARREGAPGKGPAGPIEARAMAAQQAFAVAAATPSVAVPPPMFPVPHVAPIDAGGRAVTPVEGADAAVAEIAEAAQSMRDEGTGLQEVAGGERRNANVLEGNLNLVRTGVAQSDLGVTTSQQHAEYRGTVIEQARAAHAMSREKAAMVAEHAPQMLEKADEGREDSEGISKEATDLSGEASANVPDDEEAAADAREQQGEINQATGDAANLDRAFNGSQERSRGLARDAAQATELNAQSDARIQQSTSMLERTRARLDQMRVETDLASAQVEGLAEQPAQIRGRSDALEFEGQRLVEESLAVEQRLRAEQDLHRQNSSAIPGLPADVIAEIEATGEPAPSPESQPPVIPLPAIPDTVDPVGVPGLGGGAAAPGGARGAAGSREDDQRGAAQRGAGGRAPEGVPAPIPAAVPGAAVVQRQPQAGYEDRESFDLAGPVASEIPELLGGTRSAAVESREEHEERERLRREQEIRDIQQMAGKPFRQLSSWEKQKFAMRLAVRHLGTSLSNIKFPGWGTLAIGLVNPIVPLLGVVSGLGMIASGGANLFNLEAWRRDWLGNFLKSAAEIATGLTIVLGSITALAATVAALCTAIIIFSFGTAAAVLGPVVAFCSSVMVTVGGWTIAVGKWALLLQALCFIKNLYEAGVARNAAELQRSSDRMSSDVSNAGNVVVQMGLAKLAQIGGRQLQASIARAGGGVRWAGGLTTQVGGAVGAARQGVGALWRRGAGALRAVPRQPGVGGAIRYGASVTRVAAGGVARGIRYGATVPFRAVRAVYRGLRAPVPTGLPRGMAGFRRPFTVGESVAPGWSGLRAAALQGKRAAEVEAAILALRTGSGAIDPTARARLLQLIPTVEAATDDQVRALAARTLGVEPQQIGVELVGTEAGAGGQQGATGAKVYRIFYQPEGERTMVAAVKVFPGPGAEGAHEFFGEASGLPRLNQEVLPDQSAARTMNLGKTAAGEGVIVMTAARGRPLDWLLRKLPAGEVTLAEVEEACFRTGQGLGRLHTATARATPPSALATTEMTADFQKSFAQLEGLVPEHELLERVNLPAARQRMSTLITDLEQHPGASTVVHGDFHPGNVFYDAAESHVTFIDASRVQQSIDQAGMGILSPARDVASLDSAIELFGSQYGVPRDQLTVLRSSFNRGYASVVTENAFTPQALAFHRARYVVRRLIDALTKEAHAGRLEAALREFNTAFGLPTE